MPTNLVTRARATLQLSQEQIAELLGVTQGHVSALESGGRGLTAPMRDRLQELLLAHRAATAMTANRFPPCLTRRHMLAEERIAGARTLATARALVDHVRGCEKCLAIAAATP